MADSPNIESRLTLIDDLSARLDRLERKFEAFGNRVNAVNQRMAAGSARANAVFAKMGNWFDSLGSKVGSFATNATRSFERLISTTIRYGTIMGGIAAGSAGLMLRQGLRLNQEMERYSITLSTVMHSQARANALLAWMVRFAETSPFQIQGLTESATQLESVGLSAKKWLPIIGDMASAFGGTTQEIHELIAAMTYMSTGAAGQAMRSLRRYGISRLDFERQGVRFDKGGELTSPVADAMDALERIMTTKFSGLSGRLMSTMTGVLSNIADVATRTLRETTAPVFQYVTEKATEFLAVLGRMTETGQLPALSRMIGIELRSLAERLGAFAGRVAESFRLGGISGALHQIWDEIKTPAWNFIKWFADTFARSLIDAIQTVFSSPEGRRIAATYGAYKAAPAAMGLLGNIAGGAAGTFIMAKLLGLGAGAAAAGGGAASAAAGGAAAVGGGALALRGIGALGPVSGGSYVAVPGSGAVWEAVPMFGGGAAAGGGFGMGAMALAALAGTGLGVAGAYGLSGTFREQTRREGLGGAIGGALTGGWGGLGQLLFGATERLDPNKDTSNLIGREHERNAARLYGAAGADAYRQNVMQIRAELEKSGQSWRDIDIFAEATRRTVDTLASNGMEALIRGTADIRREAAGLVDLFSKFKQTATSDLGLALDTRIEAAQTIIEKHLTQTQVQSKLAGEITSLTSSAGGIGGKFLGQDFAPSMNLTQIDAVYQQAIALTKEHETALGKVVDKQLESLDINMKIDAAIANQNRQLFERIANADKESEKLKAIDAALLAIDIKTGKRSIRDISDEELKGSPGPAEFSPRNKSPTSSAAVRSSWHARPAATKPPGHSHRCRSTSTSTPIAIRPRRSPTT